jgi:hypothetical protein
LRDCGVFASVKDTGAWDPISIKEGSREVLAVQEGLHPALFRQIGRSGSSASRKGESKVKKGFAFAAFFAYLF